MDIQRLAAFSYENRGGNPAGVVLCDELPDAALMQAIAADIGYSETVFAAPMSAGYRARYFAPKMEIPFCGHATIALGAALAAQGNTGEIVLTLNKGEIVVEGYRSADGLSAALLSPPTRNEPVPADLREAALDLFALPEADIDHKIPTAVIEAGARHLLLVLRDRKRLAAMHYDMHTGAELMRRWQLDTISLVYPENLWRYHARNPFAAGGVYEDPATGAAAAAFVAYLQELGIKGAELIQIIQGEDMGMPCLLYAEAPAIRGGGAHVRGKVRVIEPG